LNSNDFHSDSTSIVDLSSILDSLIAMQIALAGVEQRVNGPSFEWQSVRDAVEQVRAAIAATKLLSAVVPRSEQRLLIEFLDELSARYHLDSGTPIIGPPDDRIAKSVRRFIHLIALAHAARINFDRDIHGDEARWASERYQSNQSKLESTTNASGEAVESASTDGNNTKQEFDHDTILTDCTPAPRKAYLSFLYAERQNEKQLKDRPAYDWLKEHGCDDAKGLADYQLPAFDTWSRYVREVRSKLGEQKNQSRVGRVTGGSVVKQNEI